jgi:hypothetical protein
MAAEERDRKCGLLLGLLAGLIVGLAIGTPADIEVTSSWACAAQVPGPAAGEQSGGAGIGGGVHVGSFGAGPPEQFTERLRHGRGCMAHTEAEYGNGDPTTNFIDWVASVLE